MTPAKDSHEFFKGAKKFREEQLEKLGIRKKLTKEKILEDRLTQHIERQPEVIKALSKRAKKLELRHELLSEALTDMPVAAIDVFRMQFAKYYDAYSDFLATTKKDSAGFTELEAIDLVLKNVNKVKNLEKRESLIKYYEKRRLWLESKLTTFENAEEKLITLLVKKGILQKEDVK